MQTFDDYQLFTDSTSIYPDSCKEFYVLCGLIGEIGEFTEKVFDTLAYNPALESSPVFKRLQEIAGEAIATGREAEVLKKQLRSGEVELPPVMFNNGSNLANLLKEIGDILFYVSRAAKSFDKKFSEVAEMNVKKLMDRKKRGVIQGSGDNR